MRRLAGQKANATEQTLSKCATGFVVLRDALSGCSSCSKTLRIGCSSRGHLPKLFGVLKGINMLPSSDMGVRDPLLPSGTPPPLGIEFSSTKMRDLLLSFTKNFGGRTHITKRMPALIEHPSRGEEGDSTRTERRLCLISRLACEVAWLCPTENTFGGGPKMPRRSRGGYTACERLAERRVRPSSKKFSSGSSALYQTVRRVRARSE